MPDRKEIIKEWENVLSRDPLDVAWDLVDETLTLLKEQPAIVRCKDCKHRPKQTEPPKTYGFSIEFPEGSRCPCQCDDGFYSWYPKDNWFCADGEREET